MEAKLALIEILRHYTLLRSPDTEVRRNMVHLYQSTNLVKIYPRYLSRSLMVLLIIQRMVFFLQLNVEIECVN